MSEDKGQDDQASSDQKWTQDTYEVRLFAQKYGISIAEAEALIREHGSDHAVLDQAAAHLRSS